MKAAPAPTWGMPLQHAMFYGPPGTGKTMVAQRFAEYSGVEKNMW
jgi:ATPase family AAA domain-containing protein 3A/B